MNEIKGSLATHIILHRDDGKKCRITREFYALRESAKKNKKKVPPIPEEWWM